MLKYKAEDNYKEEDQNKNDMELYFADRQFVLINAKDFWGDGQWTRYCAERMKTNTIRED